MSSLLKWIWGGIMAVANWLRRVGLFLWECLQSLVTWIVAALTYILDRLYDLVSGAISSALQSLQDVTGDMTGMLDEAPQVLPLAAYYLHMMAMDEAWRLLVVYGGAWLVAKGSRVLMVPIRALLDLL